MHATGRCVDQRIAGSVHLCQHTLSQLIHELSGILAKSLSRFPTADRYSRMVCPRYRYVVRSWGGHLFAVSRLTKVGLHGDQ